MSPIELRNNFHHLIDNINNEHILAKFYSIMVKINDKVDGTLWDKLTIEEQEELIKADIESNDASNLVRHKEIQKKHEKWL